MPTPRKIKYLSHIDLYLIQIEQGTLNHVLYINYIALAIDPFLDPCYCLSIAYRLPLMPICSARMDMGPGPGPGPQKDCSAAGVLFGRWALARAHIHYDRAYRHQGQSIDNR